MAYGLKVSSCHPLNNSLTLTNLAVHGQQFSFFLYYVYNIYINISLYSTLQGAHRYKRGTHYPHMSFQLEFQLDTKSPYNQIPLAVKKGPPLTRKENLRNPREEIWVCVNLSFNLVFNLFSERIKWSGGRRGVDVGQGWQVKTMATGFLVKLIKSWF